MAETIKVLSLYQPWATLISISAKRIETRNWSTSYRGPLAIHASKKFTRDMKDRCHESPFWNILNEHFGGSPEGWFGVEIPTGCIIAICDLVDCKPTAGPKGEFGTGPKYADWVHSISAQERAFGDYSPHRFGWFLENIRPLPHPIPAKGSLGLWDFDLEELRLHL